MSRNSLPKLTTIQWTAIALVVIACATEPTTVQSLSEGGVSLAKAPACDASTSLVITVTAGPAITSDGSEYAEGVGGVGAHFSNVNGNLMLTVAGTSRLVGYSTSAGSGSSNDRLYTNSHDNAGGNNACGFGPSGLPVGATGTAALEFELANALKADVIRYGKDCGGAAVAGTRVTTTHPDVDTWTITGTSGVHCRAKTKGNGMAQIGTTGGFSMTLARQ